MEKKKTLSKRTLLDFGAITLGAVICSMGVFFFQMPSNLTMGSTAGLAIVLAEVIPLKVSVLNLILSVALLCIGLLFIGRDFGAKTIYVALLIPILLAGMEALWPDVQPVMGDKLLDMLGYVFVVAIGQAILFLRNASSGGMDIVAKLLNKFFRMELGTAVTVAGLLVVGSAIFVFDVRTVLLGALGMYLNGLVLDHFIFGMNIKKRVCIMSKKEAEIKAFILNELHSGATIYQSVGAYSNETHQEIITIVNKNEYAKLMRFIERTDPHAFVTVYSVNEVLYQPKPQS